MPQQPAAAAAAIADLWRRITTLFDPEDPREILARTAYGEARGGGARGMQSVLNVVMNRANNPRWWGHDPRSVCLQKEQFSVWNPVTAGFPQDADFLATIEATPNDGDYATALGLAQQALSGRLPDITEGADSYYEIGTPRPAWAATAPHTCDIAGQAFYRVELPAPTPPPIQTDD